MAINNMIIERVRMRRILWLAIRKQLLGDYGDLNNKCEAILLNNPRLYIVVCIDEEDEEYVRLTIKYNPLDVAKDVGLSMRRKIRKKKRGLFIIPI